MNDSRQPVCRRCAPLALWPASSKLARTPSSRPNSRNAARIETRVRKVRALRRNSAAQTRCRYIMGVLPCQARSGVDRLFDQRALVEVQGVAGVLGGLGVMGDHHDGLAMLAVERLQQAQDLLGRLPVQVARGLVADQQG